MSMSDSMLQRLAWSPECVNQSQTCVYGHSFLWCKKIDRAVIIIASTISWSIYEFAVTATNTSGSSSWKGNSRAEVNYDKKPLQSSWLLGVSRLPFVPPLLGVLWGFCGTCGLSETPNYLRMDAIPSCCHKRGVMVACQLAFFWHVKEFFTPACVCACLSHTLSVCVCLMYKVCESVCTAFSWVCLAM